MTIPDIFFTACDHCLCGIAKSAQCNRRGPAARWSGARRRRRVKPGCRQDFFHIRSASDTWKKIRLGRSPGAAFWSRQTNPELQGDEFGGAKMWGASPGAAGIFSAFGAKGDTRKKITVGR
jgi:hypothetical protein